MMAETKNTKAFNNTEIPSDWEVQKLTEVSKIFDGTHTTPNYVAEGVPFYSVEHVTSNRFDDTKFMSEEVFAKESQRVILEKGDILMTRIGDIGTTRFIDWDVRASFYVSLALIKTKEKYIDAKFLSQFINSIYFQRELYQRTIHVAFPKKINLGEIGECNVLLPPLPEQKAVAQVLSKADAAIHTTEKLIAQKELRKKWLMQQLLTGKKRLKGFGGDWVTLKIKNIGIVPGKNPITKVESQKLLTVKLHTKGIEFNDRDKPIISSSGRPYYERCEGEILIGRQNIHNGGIGIVTKEFDGHICSNAISSFKVNENHSTAYLLFHLQYPSNYQRIEDYMGGTGQKELSEKQFLDIPIKLPKTKEEQTAIAQVLQAADKEISILKAKAEKLREQKKGLMQQLLTGKIRLKL
jgi:type I restriction enzyme S subunit